MTTAAIYFKRHQGSIEGVLTLIVNGVQVVTRHPCRSGQKGYENTSWVSGKSPIPKSGKNPYFLWLDPIDVGRLPTGGGIGEFYPVSSSDKSRRYITWIDPITGKRYAREDIGLHPENKFAGSAGCTAALWDTFALKKELLLIFDTLHQLKKDGLIHVPYYSI